MQSGIVYGYIGLVKYIINKILDEIEEDNIMVIATGGLGSIIHDEIEEFSLYDRNLAFKGMKLIYERNVNINK